jgi:hypothetical protein
MSEAMFDDGEAMIFGGSPGKTEAGTSVSNPCY